MVQIEVTVSATGNSVTYHVASLLYDLWDDYTYYRALAESVDREKEPLQYKRYVRAAVHSYFGYFEGVLNSWIAELDPSIDLEEISFKGKLGIVRNHVRNKVRNKTRLPFLDIDRAREIRNTIVHVKPTAEDIDIMTTLFEGTFFSDADDFTKWLDLASQALNLERHPDVKKILEGLRQRGGD
jgi:hypothetical protein